MLRRRPLRTTVGGAALGLCACVLWLAPGAAAAGSPQDSGVYDQYTEQVPTAQGPHNTSSGGAGPSNGSSTGGTSAGGGAPVVVPATLDDEGGKDAKTLREVATSPRYGAPSATVPLPDSSTKGSPASLSAAVNAATDGGDGRMVGLFVALLAVTAVSLGFAAARRRA